MNTITIKPLTAELSADYLDFFDNRAFTDDNPNGPCYCTSPNQDEENIKQMVVEGYAMISDQRNEFDYQGPVHLYQKAGFEEVMRENGQVVMRKVL